MTEYKPWTTRSVAFTIFPRDPAGNIERMMDAVAEVYWKYPGFPKWFFEPGIGNSGRVIYISGWPWWIPRWLALRMVTNLAWENDVSGYAEYKIERTVL